MSLRDLMEGECGRPSALSRLTSHFVHDHSHRDDGLHHGIPHAEGLAEADADQWAQQFVGENSPQTFRMDSLLQEMREIESSESHHAPVQSLEVAALASADTSLAAEDMARAEQYLESGMQFDEPYEAEVWNLDDGESNQSEELFELGCESLCVEEYVQSCQCNIDAKEYRSETFRDLNQWNELQWTAIQPLNNVQDPNINASKFTNFMKQIEKGNIINEDGEKREGTGSDETHDLETEKITQSETENDHVSTGGAKMSEIEATNSSISSEEGLFSEKQSSDGTAEYSKTLWSELDNKCENLFSSEEATQPWAEEFSYFYDRFEYYPFEENNPMKEHSNVLEEGKKRLEEGDLARAVLCFEAAVQNTNFKNSEAWELLGISLADNEQDRAALPALETCLMLDPSNLRVRMALAVSLSNKGYDFEACQALREWLKKNKDYSHLVPDELCISERNEESSFTIDIYREVQDLYIAAARLRPQGNIDADVQCGLGVLFNWITEYDKAADCFKTALQVRPNDPRMWNRLGATLANGDRSVEAVKAYDSALQLVPGYIRARYNLGIACYNLGAYKEAAEHILTALNLQAQARGVEKSPKCWRAMSDDMWSRLRFVVSLLDRRDLRDAVDSRNLGELNKAILEEN